MERCARRPCANGAFKITQEDAGGTSVAGDRFGTALTVEDFNDNNAADLAVGALGDALGAGPASGTAYVFMGVPISPPRTDQSWAEGENEAGDEFGAAVFMCSSVPFAFSKRAVGIS